MSRSVLLARGSRARRATPLLVSPWIAALVVAAVLSACARSFRVSDFQGSNERLYAAALREFEAKRYDNAITAFEKLTLELPARDTLLPRAYYYLGLTHSRRKENLLAAQSFGRVTEVFPDDSLADDALYEAARSYQRAWRKPALDAQYGQSALATYRLLLTLYPNSARRAAAEMQARKLEEWFATKDYESGLFYMRRKAYDSAIIYFRDVVKNYPNASHARDANLRLVDAFTAIRYRVDATETCAELRTAYPTDVEVRQACAAYPATAVTSAPAPTADSAAAPRAPPATP